MQTARPFAGGPAALVEVTGVEGSAPRGPGAQMYVSATETRGTIGGGALEWAMITAARQMLASGDTHRDIIQPLGPEIGQCCGGRVSVSITRSDPPTQPASPEVFVFGAGHVGQALTRALAALPVRLSVIDQRADWLAPLAGLAATHQSPLPEVFVAEAAPGAAFVILTHDHALDFMIAEAALSRGDAAYVGMIGSASKRAQLVSRLNRAGVSADALTCPIGGDGPDSKRPEVIALATAAELAARLLT